MTKKKKTERAQDFAIPFSVLLFEDDAKKLAELAKTSGVGKSVLIRLAVREALRKNQFKAMAAS